MSRDRYLPSEPLVPFLERAIARRRRVAEDGTDVGGVRELARDIASRCGTSWRSEWRLLCSIRNQQRPLMPATADRLAIALDLHPGLVWGDAWWSLGWVGGSSTERGRARRARERAVAAGAAAAVGG